MGDIEVRTTDDMLDVVEALVGYTPDDLLTAIIQSKDWRPHVLCLRIETEEGLAAAVESLRADDVLGIVIWGEGDQILAERAVSVYSLDHRNTPTLRATRDEWWWLHDTQRHRRMTSMARASMVYMGISAAVAPDRATMISNTLLVEPRWGEVEEVFPPVPPSKGGAWMASKLRKHEPLNEAETAAVIGGLRLPSMTDYLVERMCQMRVTKDMWELDNMRARMVEVAAEAHDSSRGRLFRLISLASYLIGQPEVSWAAIELAKGYEPDNTLNEQFSVTFNADLDPDIVAQAIVDGFKEMP